MPHLTEKPNGVQKLTDFIISNPTDLTSLDLFPAIKGYDIPIWALQAVIEALKCNTTIKTLDLCGKHFLVFL